MHGAGGRGRARSLEENAWNGYLMPRALKTPPCKNWQARVQACSFKGKRMKLNRVKGRRRALCRRWAVTGGRAELLKVPLFEAFKRHGRRSGKHEPQSAHYEHC